MSFDQLRHSLAETLGAVADARAHADRAKELLTEYRNVVVGAQAKAEPWLPPQLEQALEQIEKLHERLHGVDDLLNRYQSRL